MTSDRSLVRKGKPISAIPTAAIFGATGFIGSSLFKRFKSINPHTIGIARSHNNCYGDFDLARPNISKLSLKNQGVTQAVIAAAITGVATCEKAPAETRMVNVTGTVELGRQLTQEGIRLIALSSDYVFDGITGNYDEASTINPVNEYGRQKAEMEARLMEVCDSNLLVLRLSKIFDTEKGSGTMLDDIACNLLHGDQILAARDQFFCPTLIEDIVNVIQHLLTTDIGGLLHVCAPTRISRLDLAQQVAQAFNVAAIRIREISLLDLGETFLRPLDTSMLCPRLNSLMQYQFQKLAYCLEDLKSNYNVAGNGKIS